MNEQVFNRRYLFKFQVFKVFLLKSKLPNRILNFVGREELLDRIESAFFVETRKLAIISSFAGTGKTSIANEYGYKFANKTLNKDFVFWIKSDGQNSEIEFQQLAQIYLEIYLDEKEKSNKELLISEVKFRPQTIYDETRIQKNHFMRLINF